ncbi:hypothetical protein LC1981_0260 [Lacticaseibacillus paracasei NRIC 1981]|nr:hypothetical protein LC1981_0260 [Lacticaseibacillus paracasei NRIC 1981]
MGSLQHRPGDGGANQSETQVALRGEVDRQWRGCRDCVGLFVDHRGEFAASWQAEPSDRWRLV